MSSPLISFIIPSYNRAKPLALAINSVIQEFGTDGTLVEIIVIDDGSTDATGDTLVGFRQIPAIKIIVFENNRGLATARNEGIQVARGVWIALLDSDNTLLPKTGSALVKQLQSLPQDIGVLWGGSQDSNGRPTITHSYCGVFSGRMVLEKEITGEHFSVIRRSIIPGSPYPTSTGSHACEAAFWVDMAKKTKFYITDQQFQYYDTSGTDRICATDNKIRNAKDFAKCFELRARLLQDISVRQAGQAHSRAALYWCVGGEWKKSIRMAITSLTRTPVTKDGIIILIMCLCGPVISKRLLRSRES
jgi:glycosyltransferase involved in cell wall biosynthesis